MRGGLLGGLPGGLRAGGLAGGLALRNKLTNCEKASPTLLSSASTNTST